MMDEESRSCAEGDEVGQRIKFPAKRAFVPAHAGDTPIEQIKNQRQEDEKYGVTDGLIEVALMLWVRFDDSGQRQETAKQIPCREQVRQKINLQLGVGLRRWQFLGL